jgi:hydroxyacylglutathione hydrolase
MKVIPICALTDNYIWTIVNQKMAICVDPGEAEPVKAFLKNQHLSLSAILLTHHHFDHINGVDELIKTETNLPIYGPADTRIPFINKAVKNLDTIALDAFEFTVFEIPGHTSSHICYYENNFGWLFCGDTLFSAGCGRVFDGSLELLYNSLETIKNLPDSTKIYCAHEYTLKNLQFAALVEPNNQAIQERIRELKASTNHCSLPSSLGLEKAINPFLRTDESTVQHYAREKGCKTDDPFSVFVQLRQDKDRF